MGTSYKLTVPSPWVNGGDCSYGGLGSNSAGGNTDTTNATCPPSQADVNEGYVSCSITVSSGNDENGQANYSTMDLFFTGQPVPQQSTAALSAASADAGATVSVTGGTNWWGNSGGAPNTGPYGDFQSGAMYAVSAPSVFIGTVPWHRGAGGELHRDHPGQHVRVHRGRERHRRPQPVHHDPGPAHRLLPDPVGPGPGARTTSTSTRPTPPRCPATVPTTPTRRLGAPTWARRSR